MWHWMLRANETVLQQLVDEFNGSQSAVKVSLVNQVGWEETLAKYKAGLSTGDLPDIVQLQETDQQQMIDTGTVLPAGVCAKADKYSFDDFLPRVTSYFTVQGTQYAMPFNTSGPVLYYNKKAFSAAGLDPEKPPTNLTELRAAAEKLKANGVPSPMGLKTDPIFLEQWTAMGNRSVREQRQRAQGARHEDGVRLGDRAPGLQLDVGHGEGRPRRDQLRHRHGGLRQPPRHPRRLPRDDHRQQRRARDHRRGPGRRQRPQHRARGRGDAGPGCGKVRGGVFVQGGELFMVNKSAPAKQAAAWQFLKFLDDPKNMTTWAIGTGYLPIRTTSAESTEMQDYWAKNPTFKVAYDQLVSGPDSIATAGSVIGPNIEVRGAVRDAENSMFLEGADPKSAIAAATKAATDAIVDYNSRIGA